MCATCGCGTRDHVTPGIIDHSYNPPGMHNHELNEHDQAAHSHNNGNSHSEHKTVVDVEKDILYQNNLLAARNRGYFEAKKILAINLVSSPGSGKTTLLERTLNELKSQLKFLVIEGDQQTSYDAERIRATGTRAAQINTGKGCHLDAHMILHALQGMKPEENSVLFIENVGNLVCPAMFDLGESERVVIMSVTEGDDKPLKYPDMFHSSTLCVINKTDLLPYVSFDLQKAKEYLHRVNPNLAVIEVSCTNGHGLEHWYDWLRFKRTHEAILL